LSPKAVAVYREMNCILQVTGSRITQLANVT